MSMTFDHPGLIDWLNAASPEEIDTLKFGVMGMTPDGNAVIYNKFEAEAARLTPKHVIGQHVFSTIAPCTNNFMVAQRFETEAEIDATIDYVFTLRMKFTPVRLRLLKRPDVPLMYLVMQRV